MVFVVNEKCTPKSSYLRCSKLLAPLWHYFVLNSEVKINTFSSVFRSIAGVWIRDLLLFFNVAEALSSCYEFLNLLHGSIALHWGVLLAASCPIWQWEGEGQCWELQKYSKMCHCVTDEVLLHSQELKQLKHLELLFFGKTNKQTFLLKWKKNRCIVLFHFRWYGHTAIQHIHSF